MPTPVAQPDYTGLISTVKEYVENIGINRVKDGENYIYEAAIEAIYGPDAWAYINQQIEKTES